MNLKCLALYVPGIMAIEILGGGCELPVLGNRRLYGVGDGIVRKSVDESL